MKQRIVYFALIFSTFIYWLVLWMILRNRTPMGTIEQERAGGFGEAKRIEEVSELLFGGPVENPTSLGGLVHEVGEMLFGPIQRERCVFELSPCRGFSGGFGLRLGFLAAEFQIEANAREK